MLTATAVWKLSIILALLQVTSPEVLKCNFPRNFTSDAYSSSTTDVYDADLEIKLDYDHLEFYGYRDKKFISIRGKDVTVDMNGFSDGEYWPELVRVVFNEELTGHAEREPMDNATYSISNCRLVLLPTNDELLPSSMVARNRIRKFAETCLEHYMCQELQQINRQDFIEISSTRPFCFSPGEPDSLTKLIAGAQYKTELEFGEFEDLWNKMMDIGLNEGLKTASDEHGVLKLPNITQEFSTGVGFFASTFKIDFFQGKLRGLMDLRRQGNWKIIKTGQKFTLSVSIELPALEMEYPKYLAHAFFTVEGQLNNANGMVTLLWTGIQILRGIFLMSNLKWT
ncbi:uncharacterized protein LOC135172706 [Diachasmimorpha longicaudata]|uniref:uncharacterized protein LOC135172706 n=1 Tax=Diachasmimorpha longicaudata TaxID=58733 RepID=UPI0030B8F9DC